MANRKWHVTVGITLYFIVATLLPKLNAFDFEAKSDLGWLLIAFMTIVFGAEFPDLDQVYKKFFSHRDMLTHSAIVPLFLTALSFYSEDQVLKPLIAFFLLGVASHLILDILPTYKRKKNGHLDLSSMAYTVGWTIKGVRVASLTKDLNGTYLAHYPFKIRIKGYRTLNSTSSKIFFVANGLICLVLASWLLHSFLTF
ncbi:MAG: metal-dependent hydrolase [Candidatus Kariarchaeaceae archaeon]